MSHIKTIHRDFRLSISFATLVFLDKNRDKLIPRTEFSFPQKESYIKVSAISEFSTVFLKLIYSPLTKQGEHMKSISIFAIFLSTFLITSGTFLVAPANAATFRVDLEMRLVDLMNHGVITAQDGGGCRNCTTKNTEADDYDVRLIDDDTGNIIARQTLNHGNNPYIKINKVFSTETDHINLKLMVIEHDIFHLWSFFGLIDIGPSDEVDTPISLSLTPEQKAYSFDLLVTEQNLIRVSKVTTNQSSEIVLSDGSKIEKAVTASEMEQIYTLVTNRPFRLSIERLPSLPVER